MPFALLKYALSREHPDDPHFRWKPDLKKTYDVIIIGAGGHGLAAAYHLAKDHGITNIAVLEKGWLAGGNTARNTTIVRSNYLTPEGVAFYKESVELFRTLSNELDINVMYSERGHFTLAHTDAAMRTARWRAEVNKHMGVEFGGDRRGRSEAHLSDDECNRRRALSDSRRALPSAGCNCSS